MANDSMGNLEKLGILVIVILVVVVGVVAITPSDTLFDSDPEPANLEDGAREGEFAPLPGTLPGGPEADAAWPGLDIDDPLEDWLKKPEGDADGSLLLADAGENGASARPLADRGTAAPLPPPSDGTTGTRPWTPELRPVAPVTQQPAVAPPVRPASRPAPSFTEYEVRDGDTLSGIAKRLTPGRSWTHIARANPDIDPNLIKANTVLRIPVAVAVVLDDAVRRPVGRAVVGTRTDGTRTDGTTASRTPVVPVSPPSAGGATTYVVRRGDSLSRIAARTLGSGKHWRKVFDANRNLLSDPDHVREGMTLRIPTAGRPVTVAPAPPSFGIVGREGDQTYLVRGGDTLSGIAQRYLGSAHRWREILDLNRDRVPSPEKLRSGVTIRLP